jgi:putative flavoprotein involved in K+ transport
MEFAGIAPDAFAAKEKVAQYFEDYAKKIAAPIRCGVEVKSVERLDGSPGFRVKTSHGLFEANNIVAATGPFQNPATPKIVPENLKILQIHSTAYKNPDQLPNGAVLVVGAGSSGVQIAEELMLAGRQVYLSVGPHERPPRAYRGIDFCWWLGVLGKWEAATRGPSMEHVTIAVSGARGGHTVDFRRLAAQGMALVGMTESCTNGTMYFKGDLVENLANGDANYLELLDEADAYVTRNGLDLPADPDARKIMPDSECVTRPIRELNLAEAGVTSIVWATGFTSDYSWLKVDAFDDQGRPKHYQGVSFEPGVYFLGLSWQSRRGSAFIWGVWHDAKLIADRINTHRKYLEHRMPARAAE